MLVIVAIREGAASEIGSKEAAAGNLLRERRRNISIGSIVGAGKLVRAGGQQNPRTWRLWRASARCVYTVMEQDLDITHSIIIPIVLPNY